MPYEKREQLSKTEIDRTADQLAALIGLQDEAKRAYLVAELSDLASLADTLQSAGAAGPSSKRTKAAHSVESACKRILSAFAIADRDFNLKVALNESPMAAILAFQIAQIVRPDRRHISALEDEESRDRIAAILDGIVILRDAARHARKQAEQGKKNKNKEKSEERGERREGPGGARRVEDWPLKETAWHILRLYIELTGQRPGVSVSPSDGKRGGPAVRFLDATLRWLGLPAQRSTTAANLINQLKDDPELLRTQQLTNFKTKKT